MAERIRTRLLGAWLVQLADPLGCRLPKPWRELKSAEVEQLIAQADTHGILPALARNFRPMAEQQPGYDRARIDAASRLRMLATHSLMLRRYADVLMTDLVGEPVAIIKGPTFARTIYPSPQLRPFSDVDLLVAPDYKAVVATTLRAHGFELCAHDFQEGRNEDKWLHRDNPALLVEVHTNMVHAPSLQGTLSLTYDDLAETGGHVEGAASQLMVAIMHAGLHQFERLRQVVDILQAARALNTADEEARFEKLVERTGARLATVAGLDLAYRLFDEPRCLDIAHVIGRTRGRTIARLLISHNVVAAMANDNRVYHTWRRQGLRELLKRGVAK